jgi:anti-sigma factor RsiW
MIAHLDDQVAAYAFGALDDHERRQVDLHLSQCAACAAAVREARQTATLLPYAVTPYNAPQELRAALLGRLRPHGPAPRRPGTAADAGSAAHPLPRPWWKILVLQALPWTAAIVSCMATVALLSYSHGQSDRITAMQHDAQTRIAALTGTAQNLQTVQSYLFTPGVKAAQLTYEAGRAAHTTVMLYYAPSYAHALLTARGLAVLPPYKTYRIWARTPSGTAVPLGRLITKGPRAEGSSLIAAPEVLSHYAAIGVSLEQQVASLPSRPILIFKVLLAQQ